MSRSMGDGKGLNLSKKKSNGKGRPVQKMKKSRGPKSHLEPSRGKIDQETINGAREMIDQAEEEEDSGEEVSSRKGSTLVKAQDSQGILRRADFLLNLDEKDISRTNAEIQKLRKAEKIKQEREERPHGKGKRIAKGKGKQVESSGDESTDMEGASLPSDSDIEESASDATSDEDSGGSGRSSLSPDRETIYLQDVKRRQKRLQLQDEDSLRKRKRKKLPTRGEAGWSSGEDLDEEGGSEDEGKDEDEAVGTRVTYAPMPDEVEEVPGERKSKMKKSMSSMTTGTRFGLQSPYEIMSIKKKSQRILLAREQIARLSTDIINDPEVSLGFIKRLSVFASAFVQSADDSSKRATVDDTIRASALLSLCAVFIDVLPGYRIRSLTEAEQKEKVNQELLRRREWEQGLVKVYRDYLELCERITRDRTELSVISLKAMCMLVTKTTHFNYRTNLLRSLVSYLSRRSWNAGSEEANEALISVLTSDNHGEVSLEVVRLLNRMIKEKKFNVNERVLEMLRHLRLKDELKADKRGDLTSVSRNTDTFNKSLKPKDIRKGKGQHLSKKGVKNMKEIREIERDLKEAEAEVDVEERERHQSETLKLLFVLYFSILKAPLIANRLYIATLRGLSLFAHRINVDFFRDLLDVLRQRIRLCLVHLNDDGEGGIEDGDSSEEEEGNDEKDSQSTHLLTALYCIVTSLELLSGQGEALNIDLNDMSNHLFNIMLPLCINPDLELSSQDLPSPSALLLRALHLCLVAPQTTTLPTERLAAFVIRMLLCSLHTPAKTTLALLQTATLLMSKKEELKGMLDNKDRAKNGYFDPSSNLLDGLRPLQSGYIPWQLNILHQSNHDEIVQQCEKLFGM